MSRTDELLASIDERLVTLETRLAYQEEALQQLNAVALEQRREIDQLTARAELLSERVRALGEPGGDDGAPETPPHY